MVGLCKMGEYHREHSSRGLHSPPASPSKLDSPRQKYPSNNCRPVSVTPTINTPTPRDAKRRRSPSSSERDQPPTNRQRTDRADDGQKVELGEGGSTFSLYGLMVNMEHMAKMVRRADFDLRSDPVLACLVSAQAVMMACTADLISRRPQDYRNYKQPHLSPSPNTSLNGAAHNNRNNNNN